MCKLISNNVILVLSKHSQNPQKTFNTRLHLVKTFPSSSVCFLPLEGYGYPLPRTPETHWQFLIPQVLVQSFSQGNFFSPLIALDLPEYTLLWNFIAPLSRVYHSSNFLFSYMMSWLIIVSLTWPWASWVWLCAYQSLFHPQCMVKRLVKCLSHNRKLMNAWWMHEFKWPWCMISF